MYTNHFFMFYMFYFIASSHKFYFAWSIWSNKTRWSLKAIFDESMSQILWIQPIVDRFYKILHSMIAIAITESYLYWMF